MSSGRAPVHWLMALPELGSCLVRTQGCPQAQTPMFLGNGEAPSSLPPFPCIGHPLLGSHLSGQEILTKPAHGPECSGTSSLLHGEGEHVSSSGTAPELRRSTPSQQTNCTRLGYSLAKGCCKGQQARSLGLTETQGTNKPGLAPFFTRGLQLL